MDGAASIPLERVDYRKLNARAQETYNFQKVSAVLADYGYRTIRLSEDWESADFIAFHNDGMRFFKIQLKGRLSFDTKYWGKGVYICFPLDDDWYIYPHDDALMWGIEDGAIGKQPWELNPDGVPAPGSYTWSYPPAKWRECLERFRIPAEPAAGIQAPA